MHLHTVYLLRLTDLARLVSFPLLFQVPVILRLSIAMPCPHDYTMIVPLIQPQILSVCKPIHSLVSVSKRFSIISNYLKNVPLTFCCWSSLKYKIH
jgi:hypothetical protein